MRARFGEVELILGDARDVLPRELRRDDQRADLVLTDPPYLMQSGGNTTGKMGGAFAVGSYDNSGALFATLPWPEIADTCRAAMKRSADLVCMCRDVDISKAVTLFEARGLVFRRLLIWDKQRANMSRSFMQPCEFGLFMRAGRLRTITNPGCFALAAMPRGTATDHPTEKPSGLMEFWMGQACPVGGLVIDPFAGSGVTLLAALRMRRRAIGVEVDPVHYEAAAVRLERAASRLSDTRRGVTSDGVTQGVLL